ncbi:MAG: Tetratricopeptide repeat protein [Bacteroidetes bacterium]|nr:Tetratricopeptide repeat protein [Bacteroidota bacterium]
MTKTHQTQRTTPLSGIKRRIFFTFTVASPLLLLLFSEALLRIVHYGTDLSLVIRTSSDGGEFYSINQSVGHRYFAQSGSIIPEPVSDRFAIKKSKNTKRIFCLGESTMAGFPYEYHATVSTFLRDRLKVLLPGYDVEVINVGLSAVGTLVVQDFMDELLNYEPDLFIVYVGHNEFYGVYGVGSSIRIPGGEWLTRISLTLLKSKTFILLRNGYNWLQGMFTKDQKPSQSLMGQMAANRTITLHSDVYRMGREIYRENLLRLIQTSKAQNVPILFSTLVSNWRGQKPFVSTFDARTSQEQRESWQRLMIEGDSLIARGKGLEAAQAYEKATQIDSMNADAYFKLGTALYEIARFDDAKQALLQARDRDALRFRATTEFENDLKEMCNQNNVPIARVDSAFMRVSPRGILDNGLFVEHVHPNVDGYFLMAKTFCQAIEQHGLLVPPSAWVDTNGNSDSVFMDLSRVTEFDRAVGKVKIDLLKRRWPFQTGTVNYEFVASNPVESVVFRMMKGGIAWSDARYLLAEFYARNKQFDLARKECLAVAKVIPFHYEPLLRYADYYAAEGKGDSAKAAYKHCFETDDNPFARIKYAMQLLEEENANAAVGQIDTAFIIDARGKYKVPEQVAAMGRYLLGLGYAKMGSYALAKENAERALAIDPSSEEARDLLAQLRARR